MRESLILQHLTAFTEGLEVLKQIFEKCNFINPILLKMGNTLAVAQVIDSVMMIDDKILYVVITNDMP